MFGTGGGKQQLKNQTLESGIKFYEWQKPAETNASSTLREANQQLDLEGQGTHLCQCPVSSPDEWKNNKQTKNNNNKKA